MRVRATLVRRTTLDGWDVLNDDVPLGRVYWVDPDRITKLEHGQPSIRTETVMRDFIWTEGVAEGGHAGWFPLEILKIEAQA